LGFQCHSILLDGYGEFYHSTAILQIIDELAKKDERWKSVERYIIHISNEPVDAKIDARLTLAPQAPSKGAGQ
jgi:hypothetical protein